MELPKIQKFKGKGEIEIDQRCLLSIPNQYSYPSSNRAMKFHNQCKILVLDFFLLFSLIVSM